MKTHPPITPSKTISLADLQQIASVMPLEREGRSRQLLGSLRRIAQVLGKPNQQITVNADFADKLRRIKPQLHRMTKRRWANVLGDLRFCCRAAGINVGRSYAPMTSAWQALCGLVEPELRRRLVRFARWCSEAGIEPNAVDDQVAANHLEWLRDGEFSKNPYHGYRLLARLWNDCGERFSQWPSYRFTLPDRRHRVNLAWQDFPESLRADLASWETLVSSDLNLDADGPDEPLAPRTIQTRKHQLLTLASAAVEAGYPASSITSLAVLCQKNVYVDALKQLRTRQGKERSSWLVNIARSILPIARHYVKLDEIACRELSERINRLKPKGQGLNQKNKQRLDRFKNTQKVDELQALAGSIFRHLQRKEVNRRTALMAQSALAIQILIEAPIRLGNLVGLNRERHLVSQYAGRHRLLTIMIEAEEVKNDEPLEYELLPQTVRLLEIYLKTYHPVLAPGGSPWLFPGRGTNRPKAASGLGNQIKGFVLEHLGVEMHTHLFRHLAAKVCLDENPGAYGAVADILGHRSIHTTRQAYAGFDKTGSRRVFQALIDPTRPKRRT